MPSDCQLIISELPKPRDTWLGGGAWVCGRSLTVRHLVSWPQTTRLPMWPHEHPCNMLPCPSHQPELESGPWGDGESLEGCRSGRIHLRSIFITILWSVPHWSRQHCRMERHGGKYKTKHPWDSSAFCWHNHSLRPWVNPEEKPNCKPIGNAFRAEVRRWYKCLLGFFQTVGVTSSFWIRHT